MPNPTIGDVHVNRPLTNISIAYMQNASNFIASTVFPNITVAKKSDTYFTYDRGDFWRNEVQRRAPGAETAGSGHRISTDSYTCDVFAIHRDVDDQTRANADSPLNLDREAAQWLAQQLLLKKEEDFVNTFFTTSLWTGSSSGGDLTGVAAAPGAAQFLQWNDANSTPVETIRAQIVAMAEKTGFKPNTLVIGPEVWAALIDHPDLLERIKYSQKGVVTMDLLAGLLDIDRVLVGWGTRNTAAEGATNAYDFYWGKSALLCYSNPNPGLMVPSAGYTFSWNGLLGSGALGGRVRSYRLERNQSDRIEAEMAYDLKQVAADLGVFFASAVA